jgi:hypothetical protein
VLRLEFHLGQAHTISTVSQKTNPAGGFISGPAFADAFASSTEREPQLKRTLFAWVLGAALTSGMALTSTVAQAEGCTKGAVVGGVAGHVAGDHGVAGAAAGCAVGHHEAKKKDKAASAAAAASQPSGK